MSGKRLAPIGAAGVATALTPSSVTVREATDLAACDAYATTHPAATVYHRPGWLRIISRAFRHRTRYLIAECDGQIAGVLPLAFLSSRLFGHYAVSLPFVNYGGVVADTPDAQRALIDAAIDATARAGASYLELRHTSRTLPALQARSHKVAMTLPLEPTPDQQWQRLDKKVRNQVRKGEKSDLQVQIGHLELLQPFYEVFARNMRDLGTPVYSRRFFEEVLTTFPDAARVFVVTSGSRPVAASIVHWHRDRIEVPWASAIRDFNPLCANVFLYWQMLRFACDRRFRTFDFGRSTPGGGTYRFKEQWGAAPAELVWEYWTAAGVPIPDRSPDNPRVALAVKAWQHLPMPLANALGPSIVRNIA
jgi:serine/alanine adding enzyme